MTLPGVIVVIGALVAMLFFVQGRQAANAPATTTTVAGQATGAEGGTEGGTEGDGGGDASSSDGTPTATTTAADATGTGEDGGDGEGAAPTIAVAAWTPRVRACVAATDPPPAEVTRLVTETPVFLYGAARLEVRAEAGLLVGDVEPGNILVLDGVDYELSQVVVAETHHTVDGQPGAFEVRLVHHAVEGDQLAVVALVAVQADVPASAALDAFVKGRPAPGDEPIPRTVDLYEWAPRGAPVGHDAFGPADGCGLVQRGLRSAPLEVPFDQVAVIEGLLAQS